MTAMVAPRYTRGGAPVGHLAFRGELGRALHLTLWLCAVATRKELVVVSYFYVKQMVLRLSVHRKTPAGAGLKLH